MPQSTVQSCAGTSSPSSPAARRAASPPPLAELLIPRVPSGCSSNPELLPTLPRKSKPTPRHRHGSAAGNAHSFTPLPFTLSYLRDHRSTDLEIGTKHSSATLKCKLCFRCQGYYSPKVVIKFM